MGGRGSLRLARHDGEAAYFATSSGGSRIDMSRNSVDIVVIDSDLLLGDYPLGLCQLNQIASRHLSNGTRGRSLRVNWSGTWFDLSMLANLGQALWIVASHFDEVRLTLIDFTDQKFRFLWQLGFFTLIQANYEGSTIRCSPDPWKKGPTESGPPLNYTPFLVHADETGAENVGDTIKRWEQHLEHMYCYPVIASLDAIHSRDFLSVLVWELVENAARHSRVNYACLGGQVFLSPSHIREFMARRDQEGGGLNAAFLSLQRQHAAETTHSRLPLRTEWLRSHDRDSFLLFTCVDIGIGIPASLRGRHPHVAKMADHNLLADAFSIDLSSRLQDADACDVHGLSQIFQLLCDYDGYLLVQSGSSMLEATRGKGLGAHSGLPEDRVLAGTIFQMLFPLSAPAARRAVPTIRGTPELMSSGARGRAEVKPQSSPQTVVVWDELGGDIAQIHDITRRRDFVRNMVRKCAGMPADPVYLDLMCMPRDRQFLSILLRSIRKARGLRGVVVINAAPEILAIVHTLVRLDSLMAEPGDVDLSPLESDLALALTRGEGTRCLPLLLPFLSTSEDFNTMRLEWVGLSRLNDPLRQAVLAILDHLLDREGEEVEWDDLIGYAMRRQPRETFDPEEVRSVVRNIWLCNRWLLDWRAGGLALRLMRAELYLSAYGSLLHECHDRILPLAKHVKGATFDKYIYRLPWHDAAKQFRHSFYDTWNALQDERSRWLCAQVLLRKAYGHPGIGESLAYAGAIVCVTPSAGLLGRDVASLLGADFVEAPSFYEIDADTINKEDWLAALEDCPVLIVCDVLDTGSVVSKVLERLRSAGTRCLAVLNLIDNLDSKEDALRIGIQCPVVSAVSVSLGVPTDAEVQTALAGGTYFEIDPHTLEPVPPDSYKNEVAGEVLQKLTALTEVGALPCGHLVQGGHHYGTYFNLRLALANAVTRGLILSWVMNEISQLASDAGVSTVVVVYPYYSPIYCLIEALKREWIPTVRRGVVLQFVVAKPCQLTGSRIGYRLGSQSIEEKLDDCAVAFVDDGIATGGTFAAVVEELVQCRVRSIRAMVLFDRIGLQPRRHLRRISQYSTEGAVPIPFAFKAFVSVNLRSYYKDNCPECIAIGALDELKNRGGIWTSGSAELYNVVKPVIVSALGQATSPRLSAAEILDVLRFHHAVLSDKPSPRQLEQSLTGGKRSPTVRLMNLQTVLLDRKLYRQVVDKDLTLSVAGDCLRNNDLCADDRARFLLHVPQWIDKDLALRFLLRELPAIFRGLAAGQPMDRYFDTAQREFLASAAAISTLHATEPKLFLADWLTSWESLLASHGLTAARSMYLSLLATLFLPEQERATEQARDLVANFGGSYAGHSESLAKRIKLLHLCLANEMRERALAVLPREMSTCLIDYISGTQAHYGEGTFDPNALEALKSAFRSWYAEGTMEPLRALLYEFFVRSSGRNEVARIRQLVAALTPSVGEILSDVKASCNDGFPELLAIDASMAIRVLGQARFLSETLLHLVKNARKACDSHFGTPMGGRDLGQRAVIQIEVNAADASMVEFCVIDNCPLSDLTALFRGLGGLLVQQHHIRKWGGELEAKRVDESRKAICLRIPRIELQ